MGIDLLGRKIEEGSWVTYPYRPGSSSPELRMAKVESVEEDTIKLLRFSKQCYPKPHWKFDCRGYTLFSDRLAVIDEDHIPEELFFLCAEEMRK